MNYYEFTYKEMNISSNAVDLANIDAPINKERIIDDLKDTYETFCKELIDLNIYLQDNELDLIATSIANDLKARVIQDPIAISEAFIYLLSRSFKVIFYYRLANFIFNKIDESDIKKICKYCAFRISEYATMTTVIEIHPEAKIGKSFVIDHGVNTLIGATSEIGDDCTILQNVVLGARKITYNGKEKRHPTIGNNVHISGGVRIFGAINIGNNVFIGPDCLITKNVSDNVVVKLERKQTIILSKNNE